MVQQRIATLKRARKGFAIPNTIQSNAMAKCVDRTIATIAKPAGLNIVSSPRNEQSLTRTAISRF